jgi:hypothetical protein
MAGLIWMANPSPTSPATRRALWVCLSVGDQQKLLPCKLNHLGACILLAWHGSSLQPADRRTFEFIRGRLVEKLPGERLAHHWRLGKWAMTLRC